MIRVVRRRKARIERVRKTDDLLKVRRIAGVEIVAVLVALVVDVSRVWMLDDWEVRGCVSQVSSVDVDEEAGMGVCTKFAKNIENTVLEISASVVALRSAEALFWASAKDVYDMKSTLRAGSRKLNVWSLRFSVAFAATEELSVQAALEAPRRIS